MLKSTHRRSPKQTLTVNIVKASSFRWEMTARAKMKGGIHLIVFFTVMALCFTLACKAKVDSYSSADQRAVSDQSELAPESAKPLAEDSKYCEVQYYYHGKELFDHHCPFERCTREGDYMIVQRAGTARFKQPVMGIRIRINQKINPIINENAFTATQDGRVLTPIITHYDNDDLWLSEITWILDQGWRTIRIDQDLMGYFEQKDYVRATARFQFDIQEGSVDWKRVQIAPRERQQPDDGLCPP